MNAIPRRVLLINDDRVMATPLATLLLVAGFELEMAFDGPTAIETAESFRPQVCLIDLNVPRLNVYEISRYFRARFDKPPLLANMTPFDDRGDWDTDAEFDLDFTIPSDPIQVLIQLTDFLRLDSRNLGDGPRDVCALGTAGTPKYSCA